METQKRTRDKAFNKDESNDDLSQNKRCVLPIENIVPDYMSGATLDLIVNNTKFRVARYALDSVECFREALAGTTESVSNIPTDSNEAMKIVLYILHHQYHALPEALDVHGLFQLAKLCDKYDLIPLVRPHVLDRGWIHIPHPDDLDHTSWCCWQLILSKLETPDSSGLNSFLDKIAARMRLTDGEWTFKLMNGSFVRVDLERMDTRRLRLWHEFEEGCKEKLHILQKVCNDMNEKGWYWASEFSGFGYISTFLANLVPLRDDETVLYRLKQLDSSKKSALDNPINSIAAPMIQSFVK